MGICKLTNKSGKYVKSHIIPKALTRPSKLGNKFIQPDFSTGEKRYIKRADSWYDKSIVIREGEDYLSELDSYAIEELRAQGLLWSSVKLRKMASSLSNGIALVEFSEPSKIRKYFLSLLWRSSVSSLPEFKNIELQPYQVERLRKIIVGEENDDLSFFPVNLIQLTSKGPNHNFTPLKEKVGPYEMEVYRFYMDGLIAHIHITDPKLAIFLNPIPYDHPIFIGYKQTVVCQVETTDSFQMDNLVKHSIEYEQYNCNILNKNL